MSNEFAGCDGEQHDEATLTGWGNHRMKMENKIEPFLDALDELLGDSIWRLIEEKVSDPQYHSIAKDMTDKVRRVRELRAGLSELREVRWARF